MRAVTETVGMAASITFSAMSASLLRSMVASADARTICILGAYVCWDDHPGSMDSDPMFWRVSSMQVDQTVELFQQIFPFHRVTICSFATFILLYNTTKIQYYNTIQYNTTSVQYYEN